MKRPTTRQRLVALATSMCERDIAAKLRKLAERGERIVLDPDSPAVASLREFCLHESVRPPKAAKATR